MVTLERLGLGFPEEYLNGLRPKVCELATQVLQHQLLNQENFFESSEEIKHYLRYLKHYRCSENGVFGIKVFARDVAHTVDNFEQLTKLIGPPTKYIVLKRKNVVKQAISMYIASKDKQWVKSGLSPLKTNIEYDFDWLLKAVNYIRLCNQFWSKIFPEENENVLFMTYEDLSKEFPTLIQQACCFLGHDTPTMPTPPLQKQFNPLKNDFYRRFKADLKQMRK